MTKIAILKILAKMFLIEYIYIGFLQVGDYGIIICERSDYMEKLSNFACSNEDAIRLQPIDEDIREPFFRDTDKIVFSLAYSRYSDKTQVFSNINNDHVTKRNLHVQMVSRVARLIGRNLGLNEDLIEAASLGHDLGHVPFGHEGERILNEISLKYLNRYFNHNVHSVRTMMSVENYKYGVNLTLQVLDAMLCHNGELEQKEYQPIKKDIKTFLKDFEETYTNPQKNKALIPMTLEGCVVRISDIIAYLGKDIEDALRLGVLKREDLPREITKVLGDTNSSIIDTFVNDIITNSKGKNALSMSEEVFACLVALKKFNYEHIYKIAHSKEELDFWKKAMNTVYETSLDDLKKHQGRITKIFLKDANPLYLKENSLEQITLDYVAGMTDEFLLRQYESITK